MCGTVEISVLIDAFCLCSDLTSVEKLRSLCSEHAKRTGKATLVPELEAIFFGDSPAEVLYALEVGIELAGSEWPSNL